MQVITSLLVQDRPVFALCRRYDYGCGVALVQRVATPIMYMYAMLSECGPYNPYSDHAYPRSSLSDPQDYGVVSTRTASWIWLAVMDKSDQTLNRARFNSSEVSK